MSVRVYSHKAARDNVKSDEEGDEESDESDEESDEKSDEESDEESGEESDDESDEESDEESDDEIDRVAVRTKGTPIKRGHIASLGMHNSDEEESTRTGIRYADYKLVCYPWAVVEVKKPGATRTEGTKCILQAANGSSACASLLRSLHMERTGAADGSMYHHPVVAFTFVGEEARVFLTYNVYDRDSELDFYGVMPILYVSF